MIVGTDTHSLTYYKAECARILQYAKKIFFTDEDKFDLSYKSYSEVIEMFKLQGVLSEDIVSQALHNTNIVADTIEEFELDKSFKYPKPFKDEVKEIKELLNKKYIEKLQNGVIQKNQSIKNA